MVLLTVVTVPSITSPGLTHFITGSVCLLTTFIHLAHPADSPASYSVLSAYTSSPHNISLVPPNMAENIPQAIAPYKCMSEREVCFLHPGEEVLSFVSFSLYIRFPHEFSVIACESKPDPFFPFSPPVSSSCSGIRLDLTFSQLPQFRD